MRIGAYPPPPPLETGVCGRRTLRQTFSLRETAVRVELQPGDLPAATHGSDPGVLSGRGIGGWVYLDDILLSARRKGRLRWAVREGVAHLRRAIFIVGGKREPTPTERIIFIGKYLDTRVGMVSNAVGALVGAFGA